MEKEFFMITGIWQTEEAKRIRGHGKQKRLSFTQLRAALDKNDLQSVC